MLKKLAQIIVIALLIGTVFTLPVQAASTYSVAGTITLNGVGLKGVSVTIKGTTLSAITNGLGNYSIHYVPAGTASSIVPTLSNYSFSPTSIVFPALTASLTGKNFTATQLKVITYSISGKITKGGVGLAGVLVTFSTFSATTASTGAYTIASIPSGTRSRIVPALAGYSFTPSSITVSGLTANMVNQNFTAVVVYTVSGKVTDAATGLPLGGVTVTLGALTATSSATTGAYTIRNVPAGTSGTLTPSLAGKTFTPPSYTITNVQAAIHAQNFVAAP
jgi:hypothetical protein